MLQHILAIDTYLRQTSFHSSSSRVHKYRPRHTYRKNTDSRYTQDAVLMIQSTMQEHFRIL